MDLVEPLLTSDDVANYMKIDVVTVRRLVNRGELAAYRIGGEYRFKADDIREYLERQYLPAQLFAAGDLDKLIRSEEHTSELQSLRHLVCRLLLEKKNN